MTQQRKWRMTVLTAMVSAGLAGMTGTVWAAEYQQGLTGDVAKDNALIQGDGSSVTEKTDNGKTTVTYDFGGRDQSFATVNKDTVSFSGKNIVVQNSKADGSLGTITLDQINNNKNDSKRITAFAIGSGQITVNSHLNVTVSSAYAGTGISVGSGKVVINGDVTMKRDDPDNPWGIYNKNVHGNIGPGGATSMDPTDVNYTGARWQGSAFKVSGREGSLTVNGNVDVAVRGTAVQTSNSNASSGVDPYDLATITLKGSSIRIVTPEKEKSNVADVIEPYYSLASYGGTVNVNVDGGQALQGKVDIVGNVLAMKRGTDPNDKENYTTHSDTYQNGRINLALTTADSRWKGLVDNAGKSHAGEVNVWLQNGAQWIHENTSRTGGLDQENMPEYSKPDYRPYYAASFVNWLRGGADASSAGIIRQNDNAVLDIANYSGNTTVVYQHSGSGEETSQYTGGDTVIHHAASGSAITLATGNNGMNADDTKQVSAVLNALAQKLTYSGYADKTSPEANLSGRVMIASGLTSSSITMVRDGFITFDADTGKGGYVAPKPGDQSTDRFDTAITGTAGDTVYTEKGVLAEDGTYHFTINPSTVEVKDGAAVQAEEDVKIDAAGNTLNLKGPAGIETNGKNVSIEARKLYIEGTTGITASGQASVVSKGTTDIKASDTAVNASNGAEVELGNGSIQGHVVSDGASVVFNRDGAGKSASLKGNVTVKNDGKADLTVAGLSEGLTGNITGEGNGNVSLTAASGAVWEGGKAGDAVLHLKLDGGVWKNTGTEATTVNKLTGGDRTVYETEYTIPGETGKKTLSANGFIQMADNAGAVTVKEYSGSHIISYGHDNDGTSVNDYTAGDFTIEKADKGSVVIAATDSKGVRASDQNAVEKTLSALAQKFYYTNAAVEKDNLAGKAMIASGLTSSSYTRWLGDMSFDASKNGQGIFTMGSAVNVVGDFETAIMKGARAAVTSSLLSWRDNANDLIYRTDLLRAGRTDDGIWARTYGGKDKYDANGINLSSNYWGAQVGYDKVYHDGWMAGAAIDYQDGSSDYGYDDEDFGRVFGNKGDNKLYSLGLYGSKDLGDLGHVDLSAKAGYVSNDFTVYNGIGNELKGSYKNRGYSASIRYGKRFGDDRQYVEPQVQMTWAHMDAKDFDAYSDGATLHIGQGSYDSAVGRIGVEAGMTGSLGTVYGRMSMAHEFGGDIHGTYYAEDGGEKKTSFDMGESWAEATLGAVLNVTDTGKAYFDVSRSFGGSYENEWKVNGGIRFALGSGVMPGSSLKKETPMAAMPAMIMKDHDEKAEAAVRTDTASASRRKVDAEEMKAAKPGMVMNAMPSTSSSAPSSMAKSAPMTFDLAPVVVTANRIPQPILEAKADISVVSRKDIEEMHMDNVEEALRTVPGVQFLNYGANGINANMSGLRINGSRDVVILVDGVRVSDFKGSGQSGYMFASLMNNMDNIERIEVLRGSASTLYGSAKGGVINIITRKVQKNQSMVDVSRGSFGKENYRLNTQGVKGKLSYNIYHDKTISGDMKDGAGVHWDGHSNNTASGIKVGYDFSEGNRLTVNYDHIASDYSGIDRIYKGRYIGDYENDSVTIKHDWKLSDLWSNVLTYRHGSESYSYAKPGGEDTSMTEAQTGDNTYDFFGEQFHYQAGGHDIVGGVEYSKGKDNKQKHSVSNTSLFAQDDWKILPKITLSGGVRHDSPDGMDSHNSFSYKLSWDMTDKDSIYAGRSDFFIVPSITQLYDAKYGNKDLKPSEGRTTSIGYNREFSGNHYFTLNWFETKTQVGQSYNETSGQYVNSYDGIARGWNAQYNVQIQENWALRFGWSHLYFNEADNFTMGYAPKDKATIGLYFNKDKWSAAFDGFYFMRRKYDNGKDQKGWPADNYGVFNLSLNYAANPSTLFYMKVENIFNKLWAEHTDVIWGGGADSWYSMPGRSVLLGMQLKF